MNRRQITAVALAAAGATTTITLASAAAGNPKQRAAPTGLHRTMSPLLESIALPHAVDVATQPMTTVHASIRARKVQQQRKELMRTLVTLTKDKQAFSAMQVAADAARASQAAAARAAGAARFSTPAASTSSAGGVYGLTGFLACVAFRESRDDPTAVNSSSGAGGLFQFMPSTWSNLGEPGLPEDAPASVQIAAAEKLYAEEGSSPWSGGGYSC